MLASKRGEAHIEKDSEDLSSHGPDNKKQKVVDHKKSSRLEEAAEQDDFSGEEEGGVAVKNNDKKFHSEDPKKFKLETSSAEAHAKQRALVERFIHDYEQRFGNVDQALSDAVRALASETAKQQESIATFAAQIDAGCSQAVQRLQGIATTLGDNTAELSETFDDFLTKLPALAKA